jgi:hypothetical protein
VGVWIGEWGWFGRPSSYAAKIAAYARAQDRRRWGGVWWQWNTACGNPGNFSGPNDDSPVRESGNLLRHRCPSGKRIPTPGTTRRVLARPYPRAAPGTLTQLRSDPGTASFTLAGVDRRPGSGSCKLDLWVPRRGARRPKVSGQGIKRVRRESVPGGWRVRACATGRYRVRGGYG